MRKTLAVILSLSLFAVHLHGADDFFKPSRGARVDFGHPINRGLVGWWIFSEGTGDTLYDISREENHGTLTNMDPATDWASGRNGWALDFDGSDDYVDAQSAIIPTGDFTSSAWFQYETIPVLGSILGQYLFGESGRFIWHLLDSNNRLEVDFDGKNLLSGGTSLSANAMYHGVVVRSGSDWTLYINGGVDDTATSAVAMYQGANTIIGSEDTSPSYPFDGVLDDVRIYNRALSAEEVRYLYSHPYAGLKQPENIAWSFGAEEAAAVTNPPRRRRVIWPVMGP